MNKYIIGIVTLSLMLSISFVLAKKPSENPGIDTIQNLIVALPTY